MKAIYRFFLVLMLVWAGSSCRQQDIRTKTIRVPQLKNAACQRVIQDALSKADGVFGDKVAFSNQTVTVTYDSMKLAQMNLEFIIAGAGFTANETPADPRARDALPAECK